MDKHFNLETHNSNIEIKWPQNHHKIPNETLIVLHYNLNLMRQQGNRIEEQKEIIDRDTTAASYQTGVFYDTET